MMNLAPILVLKTGEAVAEVKRRHGDFEAMFARAMSCEPERLVVLRPDLGEELPSSEGFAGILVTGSAASVTRRKPWMERTVRWLREAAESGSGVFGVCFGHQLLAVAFGGRVEKSPKGREIGTATVRLTPAGIEDPLFAGLPGSLVVQETHEDIVVEPPPGAQVLAANDHTEVQALAIGPNVRTVQFHPEFCAEICRGYLEARREQVELDAAARGEDPAECLAGLRAEIRESEHGRLVLAGWMDAFATGDLPDLERAGQRT